MSTRVREAGQRLGIEPHQLDSLLGRDRGWSWDLYAYEDEAATTISLADLRDVARALGVTPAYLLREDGPFPSPLSFADLRANLRAFLPASGMDIAAFGDQVGWTLEAFMDAPEAAWEWNGSGLHDICAGLGVDWKAVLAWLPGGV